MNYKKCNNKICRNEYYGLKINYFSQNDEFIFSCLGENGNITYCIFNNDFDYEEINKFENCDSINGYSTLFSNIRNNYYIISDENCTNNIISQHYLIKKIEEEEKEEEEEEIKNKEENEREEEEMTEEINEYKCKLKKCEICDRKSEIKNLCKKCNFLDKYYPIKFSSTLNNYIDCFNETTKPSNFYLNNNYYEPCFENCATCEYGGNEINNNCSSCEVGFIFKPDSNDLKNCLIKCQYYYYYTYYDQYKCTINYHCPDEYNLLIDKKGKCINNCSLDENYTFQYNGECLTECPKNTSDRDNDSICKDDNINKCLRSERDIIISNENITEEDIEKLAKNYAKEFSYTSNHISSFKYNNYEIVFYKNNECITNLSLEIPKVYLGKCYEKIQNHY